MSDGVTLTRDGAIATVVLSNPKRLNAMTPKMWRELKDCMDEASADDDIPCLRVRYPDLRRVEPVRHHEQPPRANRRAR